jgi:hypothetical protein
MVFRALHRMQALAAHRGVKLNQCLPATATAWKSQLWRRFLAGDFRPSPPFFLVLVPCGVSIMPACAVQMGQWASESGGDGYGYGWF